MKFSKVIKNLVVFFMLVALLFSCKPISDNQDDTNINQSTDTNSPNDEDIKEDEDSNTNDEDIKNDEDSNTNEYTVSFKDLPKFVSSLSAGNYTIKVTGYSNETTISELKQTIPADVYLSLDLTEFSSSNDFWESAFYGCTFLTDVIVPYVQSAWLESAFENCTNLKTVTLLDGFDRIGDNMFYNCSSLESIIIPKSIYLIGIGAFDNCRNLKKYITS